MTNDTTLKIQATNKDSSAVGLLIALSLMERWKIELLTRKNSIRENLQWRRELQVSLAKNKKTLDFTTQMSIIDITMIIERDSRKRLYSDFYMKAKGRYKNITDQKAKSFANDAMEKMIRKYSY